MAFISPHGDLRYEFIATTNIAEFQRFIDTKMDGLEGALLVMDRHPAHRNVGIKAALEAKGLEILHLPTNSSALNPVEHLWAVVKREFASALVRHKGNPVDIKCTLKMILDRLSLKKIQDIAKCQLGPLTKVVLENHIV